MDIRTFPDGGTSGDAASRLGSPARERRMLWALLFGNFMIGTGILLPAGMLSDLAAGLQVSVPTAGTLMLASGIVVALGAPLFAAATSGVNRRLLLTASLVLYIAAHIASSMATSFGMLLAIRVVMVIGAAIFTPQAVATLSPLIPPERRSATISFIFLGWSLASVGGMALGGYIAHHLGWPAAFQIVAALSLAAAIAVWLTVPGRVHIAPLNFHSWRKVFTNPSLTLVLFVTVLNASSVFAMSTYIDPVLKNSLAASPAIITLVLAWYGICATIGNVVATRAVAAIAPPKIVLGSILLIFSGLVCWGLASHALATVLLAATLWGAGTFAAYSIQQARLSAIAPELASASIALNTSAIYIGQGIGATFGGALIAAGHMPMLPWASAATIAAAGLLSIVADRVARR